MGKDHFISFMAYVTTDQVLFRKLYPEQTADARFPYRGLGTIFAYCNRPLPHPARPAQEHRVPDVERA